jgi:valyl-tRNA synthetase
VFDELNLSGAVQLLQSFFLNDYCDVYLEATKRFLNDELVCMCVYVVYVCMMYVCVCMCVWVHIKPILLTHTSARLIR